MIISRIFSCMLALVLLFFVPDFVFVPRVFAEIHRDSIEVDVYIDPLDYFYYYYSFSYFTRALDLDGISSTVQSLNKIEWSFGLDSYAKYDKPKIYVVILYERNLEKYQEIIELISSRQNLVLWVITPKGGEVSSSSDFTLDATTSASSKDTFLQDFRNQILPRILTLYTKIL